MNETQQRIYNYISKLCNACILIHPKTGDKFNNMSVLLTRQDIANELNISEKTVQRNINWLVDNKYIYKLEYNHSYIYSIKPITDNYLFCMVKVSS